MEKVQVVVVHGGVGHGGHHDEHPSPLVSQASFGDSQPQLRGGFPFRLTRRPLQGVIPPCDLTIDDRRALVRPHAATDTIGDLAEALGLDPRPGLWIDGVHVAADRPLQASGLRVGAAITTAPPAISGPVAGAAVGGGGGDRAVRAVGPGGRSLRAGSWSGGLRRAISSSRIRRSNSTTGSSTTTGGVITFTQLTGRVPARLDGELCAADQSIEPGRSLHLGASRIVFRGVGESPAGVPATTDRPASAASPRRSPTRGAGSCDAALPDPTPRRRRWSLFPPLPPNTGPRRSPGSPVPRVAAAGACLMAVVLGQPLFAAFALLGAIASVSTWVVGACRCSPTSAASSGTPSARAREVPCRPRCRSRRRHPDPSSGSPGRRRGARCRRTSDLGTASGRAPAAAGDHRSRNLATGRRDQHRRSADAATGPARRRRSSRATRATFPCRSPWRPATSLRSTVISTGPWRWRARSSCNSPPGTALPTGGS